jgi:DHA2 family multidrug resistance protein
MTNFDLLMGTKPIIVSGLLQGFGIGLSYVPLSTLAFATLPAALRNEGTAFFNLLRNIGSAIGISVVQTLLTQNTQVMHAYMAERITPYALGNPAFAALHIDPANRASLAGLDGMIANQAAMIAYIDDFKLMMVITICVIPLLFILKSPKYSKPDPQHAAVME